MSRCLPVLDQRAVDVDRAVPLGEAATWDVRLGTDVSSWTFSFQATTPGREPVPVVASIDETDAATGRIVVSISAGQIGSLGAGTWVVWLSAVVGGSDPFAVFAGYLRTYDQWTARDACGDQSDVVTITRWAG